MKTIEMIGVKRADLGKKASKALRKAGKVPCVVYGGKEVIHFSMRVSHLKALVYTPEAHFVKLTVAEKEYKCILQDIQFHPVSDHILHADFLKLFEHKKIKMNIPLVFSGKSPGVEKGGELLKRKSSLCIHAYPKDMPTHINIDISTLDLGKAIKVKNIPVANYEILETPSNAIAAVEVPRALRSKTNEEEANTEVKTTA